MSQTLKLQEQDALLELEVTEFGEANSWVIRPDLDRFLRELRALDQSRQGQAVLASPSPDGLRLEFYSTDSAGHMAIRGHLGRTDTHGFLSQLRFGFTFEPNKLLSVLEYFETICRKSR